jgi:hypothetical protein
MVTFWRPFFLLSLSFQIVLLIAPASARAVLFKMSHAPHDRRSAL